VLGVVLERIAISRLYSRDHLDHVLATFGLVLFFNEMATVIWGPQPYFLPVPPLLEGTIDLFRISYPAYRFAIIAVGLAVAIGAHWLMHGTRLGMLIRAGATNPKMVSALGVNIEFLSKYYLEASTQLGLAGRQTLAFDSYIPENDSLFRRGESTYEIGIENTLNAVFRLGSQATLDLRTEIFAPDGNFSRFRLDDLTADFRFFLSRNLEVGYIYQIKESKEKVKNRYPSSHNLSLRLSFNY